MSWFADIFSSGVSSVITSVGSVIDNIHTSDAEKLDAKQKILEELNTFKKAQLAAQAQYDKEITERWKSDNEHLVTRLTRPLSFAFVLLLFCIIVIFDGNIGQFSINPSYIPVIEGLLLTMVIALFGSRGAEKITKQIKKGQ